MVEKLERFLVESDYDSKVPVFMSQTEENV